MSEQKQPDNLQTGGCICGDIKFEFLQGAVYSSHHCHCSDCQRTTGSGFSTFCILPKKALNITQGEARFYDTVGETGNTVTRGFCPKCGSPLISYLSSNPKLVVVKAGALDNADWLQPSSSFWTSSAHAWAKPDPDIKGFEENPH